VQFDSLTFIVFFTVIATGYWRIESWSHRKTLLLLASYVFYAAWNPLFLPLLLITSLLDWRLALFLDASQTDRHRRLFMLLIIGINLSVLGWFKYWNFFLDNLNALTSQFGLASLALKSDVALPIGISFYTFHSLSYCIDIYRRKITAVRSARDYFLYIAFFPQLVAGPIIRWTTMGHQLQEPRILKFDKVGIGLILMLVGLFQKIVVADRIFAPAANRLFANAADLNGMESWLAASAFSGQIFADFAGYTTCALGAAMVLGFTLPINFKAPYAADGFSDFWRRWHISLSSWLRDYLYISLGGNRGGRWLTYRNLMLTMLLGGLWHGAAWTFVVWGALHGSFLILERMLLQKEQWQDFLETGVGRYVYRLLTLLAVMLAWIYFRADSLEVANSMIWTVLTDWASWLRWSELATAEAKLAAFTFGLMLIFQWRLRDWTLQEMIEKSPAWILGVVCGSMLAAIVLNPGDSNAFIYFQF